MTTTPGSVPAVAFVASLFLRDRRDPLDEVGGDAGAGRTAGEDAIEESVAG